MFQSRCAEQIVIRKNITLQHALWALKKLYLLFGSKLFLQHLSRLLSEIGNRLLNTFLCLYLLDREVYKWSYLVSWHFTQIFWPNRLKVIFLHWLMCPQDNPVKASTPNRLIQALNTQIGLNLMNLSKNIPMGSLGIDSISSTTFKSPICVNPGAIP